MKFAPNTGDVIEFLSDRQTDKGPCSGKVQHVGAGFAFLSFSDEASAMVELDDVKVANYSAARNHPDRLPYWGLE